MRQVIRNMDVLSFLHARHVTSENGNVIKRACSMQQRIFLPPMRKTCIFHYIVQKLMKYHRHGKWRLWMFFVRRGSILSTIENMILRWRKSTSTHKHRRLLPRGISLSWMLKFTRCNVDSAEKYLHSLYRNTDNHILRSYIKCYLHVSDRDRIAIMNFC